MDVYVLDKDLQKVGIIDVYKSLIWAERYKDVGDCELYLSATQENVDLLKIGYWLKRNESAMLCQIKKIGITTNAENGNYLIVTGKDAKAILDQRIIWTTQEVRGLLETAIRKMVNDSVGADASAERQITDSHGNLIFTLGPAAGFTTSETTQASYKNVGEIIRDYCQRYGWGYKITEENASLVFTLYAGQDRSGSVVFSDEYENLISSSYTDDGLNMGNVAVVAGEGQGANRATAVAGSASGFSRYEVYVDARDVTREITYGELKRVYPLASGGVQGGHVGGDSVNGYYYYEDALIIRIYSSEQQSKLQTLYPSGHVIITPTGPVFSAVNVKIAEWRLESGEALTDEKVVTLRDEVYDEYLYVRGYTELANYGERETFDGVIAPETNYLFGTDYALGDIVTVANSYGVRVAARITEAIEVDDETGHYITPKYEYVQ